ncbi:MAG: hypothetical protein EOP82_00010 [Variovorax sp.]|nr:MAG: hypothetical protein EOP82_00010 [Variovorax sp.]
MADAQVDVELVSDLALEYADGAEAGLDDDLKAAWEGVLAVFPGLTLSPLFASLAFEVLSDIVDTVRMGGEAPPDPFTSFTVRCEESIAAAVQDALAALPFVRTARVRQQGFDAGIIAWGTNRETEVAFQLLRAPGGVDPMHTWQVEGGTGRGVRLADVETGWDLNHEDLLTASVQRASTFGASFTSHGNGAIGVVLASDNGVGIVGIAPDVACFLVTTVRANGTVNNADAVTVAADAVGSSGVLLIEQALPFFAGANEPDILFEFDPNVQKAIRIATFFGITVVEPAGNGGVDLDAFPFMAHVQPGNPAFVDSRAIVVGAAVPGSEEAVEQAIWRPPSRASDGASTASRPASRSARPRTRRATISSSAARRAPRQSSPASSVRSKA